MNHFFIKENSTFLKKLKFFKNLLYYFIKNKKCTIFKFL